MKLVKNKNVVKFPRASGSVYTTFKRAIYKAHKEKWTKIVIIGEGKVTGSYQTNDLIDTVCMGMCAKAMTRMSE